MAIESKPATKLCVHCIGDLFHEGLQPRTGSLAETPCPARQVHQANVNFRDEIPLPFTKDVRTSTAVWKTEETEAWRASC
jgi:hypothetical protein